MVWLGIEIGIGIGSVLTVNSCVRANDVVEGETHERRVQLQLVVARVLQQKDPCVELPGETLTNCGIRDSVDDHQTAPPNHHAGRVQRRHGVHDV